LGDFLPGRLKAAAGPGIAEAGLDPSSPRLRRVVGAPVVAPGPRITKSPSGFGGGNLIATRVLLIAARIHRRELKDGVQWEWRPQASGPTGSSQVAFRGSICRHGSGALDTKRLTAGAPAIFPLPQAASAEKKIGVVERGDQKKGYGPGASRPSRTRARAAALRTAGSRSAKKRRKGAQRLD